jgi:menaquinone-dependent protoporphyrinogen IX oxidase
LKLGIIYGTKRKKATVEVIEWLMEACKKSGIEVEVGKPEEVSDLDHDAFVVGSSIYAGQAQSDLLEFVEQNRETLTSKPVATFVVCKEVECPEDNMAQILERLGSEPISQLFVEGYMIRRGNFDRQRVKVEDWVKDLISKLS